MPPNNQSNQSNAIVNIIGLLASIIAIFAFITGFSDIPKIMEWIDNQETPPQIANGSNKLRIVFSVSEGDPSKYTGRMGIIDNNNFSIIGDHFDFLENGGELSPDGQFIAYLKKTEPDKGIYIVHPDGTGSRLIAPLIEDVALLRWLPDSTAISFITNLHDPLRVIPIDSLNDKQYDGVRPGAFSWSPTGAELVYTAPYNDKSIEGNKLYVSTLDGNTRLLLQPDDQMKCERGYGQLFIGPELPSWSPNADTIAFKACGDLYTISSDGSSLKKIVDMPASAPYLEFPRWSPDGRSILFVSYNKLMRVQSDGNDLQTLGILFDPNNTYGYTAFSIGPLN